MFMDQNNFVFRDNVFFIFKMIINQNCIFIFEKEYFKLNDNIFQYEVMMVEYNVFGKMMGGIGIIIVMISLVWEFVLVYFGIFGWELVKILDMFVMKFDGIGGFGLFIFKKVMWMFFQRKIVMLVLLVEEKFLFVLVVLSF